MAAGAPLSTQARLTDGNGVRETEESQATTGRFIMRSPRSWPGGSLTMAMAKLTRRRVPMASTFIHILRERHSTGMFIPGRQ